MNKNTHEPVQDRGIEVSKYPFPSTHPTNFAQPPCMSLNGQEPLTWCWKESACLFFFFFFSEVVNWNSFILVEQTLQDFAGFDNLKKSV